MKDRDVKNVINVIPFSHDNVGVYNYVFNIDKKLFEKFENTEINDCKIAVEVTLNQTINVAEVSISMNGYVEILCDRCLGYFQHKMKLNEVAIVKNSQDFKEDINFLVYESDNGGVDLDQYFYDMIITAIPMHHVHPEVNGKSTCDQDMIERINSNHKVSVETDARWDKLKNLI